MTIEQSNNTKDTKTGSSGAAMKVTNSTIHNGVQGTKPESADKRAAVQALRDASPGIKTDRVELSVSQERIDRLTTTLAAMEGANSEKIESLKRQIAEGSYNISGKAVAEKMLRSLGVLDGGDGA